MTLGLKIKAARKAKGLTQQQLGKLIGVSRHVIIFYEANKTKPTETTIEHLEEVLEVKFDTWPEETEQAPSLQTSSIDYKQVVEQSIISEDSAILFASIFDFIESIAGKQLSSEDKKGINEFREVASLYEKKKELDLEKSKIEEKLTLLRQKTRI